MTEVLPDGGIRMVRDDVEERWQNHGDALEQTWHFATPPRGEGDLVIHVATTGLRYTGRTDTGLHFGGRGLGFRYGNATWVDAAGRRTLVDVRWDDERLALTVPEAVLDGSAYPAVLDPTISPEVALDRSIPVNALFQNGSTRVAAADDGFLVVWHTGEGSPTAEIRAVRVDVSGNVLDPLPIVVGSAPYGGGVALAGDGPDFLVAWTACANAGGVCDVKAVRVRLSDGALLQPLTIAPGATARPLAIAHQGTRYFVGWSTATEIRGSLVQDGAVIAGGSTGRPYATVPAFSVSHLVAAAAPSNFMLAWGHKGIRIAPADGAPLDPAPVAFAGIDTGFGASPVTSVAYDGANYYGVWTKDSRLLGSRIRASDGQPLDPDDTFNAISGSIVLADDASVGQMPKAVFDGTWLLVSTAPPNGVVSTVRVAPATGKRSDAPGTPLSYPPSGAVPLRYDMAVRNGRGFVVSDDHGGAFSITNGVLSTVAASKVLAKKGHPSSNPIVASNGSDYLVVWEDHRAGTFASGKPAMDLYGARIRASDRAVLDPTGFLIGAGGISSPALASDGTDYLVTYVSGLNAVTARKIRSSDATVGAPVSIGTGQFTSVACDATNCLVGWTKHTIDYQLDLALAAVRRLNTTSMTLIDASPKTLASSGTSGTFGPISVAVDSPADPTKRTFLLAWAQGDQLRASRVRATTGSAVDVAAGNIKLGKGPGSSTRLAVTSNGADFLVAWYENRTAPQPSQGRGFYATRVDALNGTVLDGVQAGLTGVMVARVGIEGTYVGGVTAPSLAYTGLSYLLSWGAAVDPAGLTNIYSVRGRRMTSSLSPLDPETGTVIVSTMRESAGYQARYGPSIASRANLETLLAYCRYDEAPTALGERVKARILVDDGIATTPPDAGADASDASTQGGVSEAGADDEAGSDAATTGPADASSDSGGTSRAERPDAFPPDPASNGDGPVDTGPASDATEDGGCGCRLAAPSTGAAWRVASLVPLAFAVRRRRRKT